MESIPEFRKYNSHLVATSISTSKSARAVGLLAYIVPLRYKGGKMHRKGQLGNTPGYFSYTSPGIQKHCPEALYILAVLVPKFFSMRPKDRFETLVHELYHIHPEFRGDLRLFPKPHQIHGPTPKRFQKKVEELTRESLKNMPELMQHPLIQNSHDYFAHYKKRRFNLPKRSFVEYHDSQLTLF